MARRKRPRAYGAIIQVSPVARPRPTLRFEYDPETWAVGGEDSIIERVARPRRRTATVWLGVEPLELELLLTFDRLAANRSLEADLRLLRRMKLPLGRDDGPIVRIAGRWEHPNVAWRIQSIRPEGEQIRRDDGRRVRQDVIVTFVEHVDARVRMSPAQRAKARKKKP